MNGIKQFFSNHTTLAKVVATTWVILTTLWGTNEAFRAYVLNVYAMTPKPIHNAITGIIVPLLILWKTQQRTTATAEIAPGEDGKAEASASVTK